VAEEVYLGLRSDAGLALRPGEETVVLPWQRAGWMTVGADGHARCTAAGWLRLDSLATALTHHRSR